MTFHDLIPWSRRENRLPAPVRAKQEQEAQMLSLLYFHREGMAYYA